MITNKKTLYWFAAIIVVGLIGIGVAKLVTAPKTDSSNSGNAPKATQSSQPVFNNIDKVLPFGVSTDQEADLRYALTKYVATLSPKPTKITLSSIAAAPYDSQDPNARTAVTFNLTTDSTTVKGVFQYFSLTGGNLSLTASGSSTVLYSSGDLDLFNNPPAN